MAKLPKLGPIGWTLLVAEVAVILKHHWDRLEPHERTTLVEIVRRSKGRPKNLNEREKRELRRLVDKIGPKDLAKNMAGAATPFGGRRR